MVLSGPHRSRIEGVPGAVRALGVAAVLVATALSLSTPRAMAATEAHSFDATLSLTGGCTVESLDPVPDPGCPGGAHPPAGSFTAPKDIAIDSYGDIYVASFGNESANGREGRIDVFDSSGRFLTEIVDPNGPSNIAVDTAGNLYVYDFRVAVVLGEEEVHELVRYAPSTYDPGTGAISYGNSPTVVDGRPGNNANSLAVDQQDDHLFSFSGGHVIEYGSAAEGNPVVTEAIGAGELHNPWGTGLAVDAADGRIYVNDGNVVSAFELASPHARVETIERSATPAGGSFSFELSVAVDEGTGHVFVYDGGSTEAVYEFAEDGTYLSTISHGFRHNNGAGITVDNGADSPNGALDPSGRYLFVPSAGSKAGHAFAFSANPPECAPEVTAASSASITETEAELGGVVNPCHAASSYALEYTPAWSFEEVGFADAKVAGEGSLGSGGNPVEVEAAATGLEPGTAYRFRLVATNPVGTDEEEGSFATYPSTPVTSSCPNSAMRTGPSALLPDCRAYELVTPPMTNARSPIGVGHLGPIFSTLQAAPDGEAVSFDIEGGTVPGFAGTGSYAGDPYLATRAEGGWTTSYVGPSGAESPTVLPGGRSPDQGWSFWSTGKSEGSASVDESTETSYVRSPGGTFTPLGIGSLGIDPFVEGNLISTGGGHVIFSTTRLGGRDPVQLEPDAPPSGTAAIYDRTGAVTHVVSLLPGDVTPGAGEDAVYLGASRDGLGIAFTIEAPGFEEALYLRYADRDTFKIGRGVTFAGIAEGGGRIFYVEGGNLFAFDVGTEAVIPFTTSANVTVVNVSADGGTAFFVSPSALSKVANAVGQKPKAGRENLYRSEEGAISFIGTVTSRDVEGENGGNLAVGGLGLWTDAVGGTFGVDPSRSTPDGRSLLFESRAALGPYDPEGHAEVYLYDSVDGETSCLSCMPTEAPATGQADLESISQGQGEAEPFSSYALLENLDAGGRRAFFQSTEALVPGDTDGVQDVYEWEAGGVGSCGRPGGCVFLVSSGHSAHPNYLFAVSESGDDAFFISPDVLLASDAESTPSIYDARVGGGFAEATERQCEGEGCRPGLTPPPILPTPAVPAAGAKDNVTPKACPKGKKRVRKHGAARCVKRRTKHHKAAKRGGK
jgi:hypothetical protein